MHFVTGGAFNGKRRWVEAFYGYPHKSGGWHSFYESADVSKEVWDHGIVVLEGMEMFVKNTLNEVNEKGREQLRLELKKWCEWEQSNGTRKLVLIGSDIGKGIVPIEKEHRLWRDMAGWFYQDIVSAAYRVDVIWYGLSERLK
ncbi:bifunctional adenosylcobinamide kinase/adenosylcobinamide-phosphate guanylyltransferase [Fictibacillus gelatini]|uniref:bifunctional adenosylcobinamide kinase/adenosylcobinamide-phosphate guanylyltransferase n=1 Tax=Fictibacillus gelatini TaxID=225985 RepID=UPI000410DCFE|nr:bifunctional adenosylcobinamide kinase/adenosylcobinamide-phosphate guanylyltransferase [Fictibacillus gelatini]